LSLLGEIGECSLFEFAPVDGIGELPSEVLIGDPPFGEAIGELPCEGEVVE